ncbi:signal peptidase I [Niveispirillum sp. SYP-B3756]|nr:signal peptidase I [Niveispirillum sp. SYP-B3756]
MVTTLFKAKGVSALRALIREWAGLIGFVAIFYFTTNTFLFAGFHVPSESMLPTLKVGDQFYAAKYAYGYSRFSTSFVPLPFGEGRFPDLMPERGDVVVARIPRIEEDYVKRVIGLPGDRIQVIGGRLHINGEMVPREKLRDYSYRDNSGFVVSVTEYKETLPGGREHLILEQSDNGRDDNTQVYVVPAGHVFLMGDNRDNSQDSRYLNQVGYVPIERVLGRVSMVAFARRGCNEEPGLVCPGGGWFDRLFHWIQ